MANGPRLFASDAGRQAAPRYQKDYGSDSVWNYANGASQPWNVFQLPQTSHLSVRSGVRRQGFDVSLFSNNLTNSHTVLAQTPSIRIVPTELLNYQHTTFRPRTYGVTASYRF